MIKTEMRPVKPHKTTVSVSDMDEYTLNWAVAKALGMQIYKAKQRAWLTKPYGQFDQSHRLPRWQPCSDWAQGGPIIEREGLGVTQYNNIPDRPENRWQCVKYQGGMIFGNHKPLCLYGPTPLIAAMRCFVASKLGEEIEVTI